MGIGLVFVIYLIVLCALAVPAVAISAGLGYFLARKNSPRVRRISVLTACVTHVVGAVYIVGCIFLTAIVGVVSGRDPGFGDSFDLPLHNHYRFSAIDSPDSAEVYDQQDRQATDGNGGTHLEEEDRNAFANVLELQEEGDWLGGAFAAHDNRFDRSPGKQVPDHWFLFNTHTHQRIDASSESELKADATAQGLHLRLQSSEAFYSGHRLTWIDRSVIMLLLMPPAGALFFLWK